MSIFLNNLTSIWGGRIVASDSRHCLTLDKWGVSNTRGIDAPFLDGALWPSSRGLGGQFTTETYNSLLTSGYFENNLEDVGGQQTKKLIGLTFDSNGFPLGSCIIQGFLTANDVYVGQTVSDSGGYYELPTPYTGAHYIVAYKSGSPDVAGTSVNTLIPV